MVSRAYCIVCGNTFVISPYDNFCSKGCFEVYKECEMENKK
jgi:hypothetical protein